MEGRICLEVNGRPVVRVDCDVEDLRTRVVGTMSFLFIYFLVLLCSLREIRIAFPV